MSVISPSPTRFPVPQASMAAIPGIPVPPMVPSGNFLEEQAERLANQSFDSPSSRITRMARASTQLPISPEAHAARKIQAFRAYMGAPDASARALLLQYERLGRSLDFSENAEMMTSLARSLYGSETRALQAEGENWQLQLSASLLYGLLADLRFPTVSDQMVPNHSLARIKSKVTGIVAHQLMQMLLPEPASADRATYEANLERAQRWATQIAPRVAPDPLLYRMEMPENLRYGDAEWWDLQRGLQEAKDTAQPMNTLPAQALIALGRTVFSATRSGRPEAPTSRDLVVTVFVHDEIGQVNDRELFERYFKRVAGELINNVSVSALAKVTVKFVRNIAGVTNYAYQNSSSGQSLNGFESSLRGNEARNYVRAAAPYQKYMLLTANQVNSSVLGVSKLSQDVAIATSDQNTVAHELGHTLGATHEQAEIKREDGWWGHSTMNAGTDIGTTMRKELGRFSPANMQTIREQLIAAAQR